MEILCNTISKHDNGGEVITPKVVDFNVKAVKKMNFQKFEKLYGGYIKGDLKKLFERITGKKVESRRSSKEVEKD